MASRLRNSSALVKRARNLRIAGPIEGWSTIEAEWYFRGGELVGGLRRGRWCFRTRNIFRVCGFSFTLLLFAKFGEIQKARHVPTRTRG